MAMRVPSTRDRRIGCGRAGDAFGGFLEEPGERDAGVQHQLGRHQRARRSPRASASACPAVRAPRILCSRRMLAAIRFPAARRFAATTLRATIKGSETFTAAPILLPRASASNPPRERRRELLHRPHSALHHRHARFRRATLASAANRFYYPFIEEPVGTGEFTTKWRSSND